MTDTSLKKSSDNLIRVSDELRFGWRKTMANLKPWLWLCGIGAFLSIVQNVLSRPGGFEPVRGLLGLCFQALQVAVMLASFRLALRLTDEKPVSDLDPRQLLTGYLPFLLTHVLFMLIVVGGMILLIVPGVVWAVTYGFAPLLCAAEGDDPVAALRESRRLTRGHRRSLFVFCLACLGVNLLGALALGIGLFVTIPTTVIATTHVLRRLQAQSPRSLVKREPPATALVPDLPSSGPGTRASAPG